MKSHPDPDTENCNTCHVQTTRVRTLDTDVGLPEGVEVHCEDLRAEVEPVGVELLGDEPDAVRAQALVIHAHLHLVRHCIMYPLDLDIIYTLRITVAGAEAALARVTMQTKLSTDNMVQQLIDISMAAAAEE